MRHFSKILGLSLLASTIALTACSKEQTITDKTSFDDKASYAIGLASGSYVKKMKEDNQKYITTLNDELILQGYKDGLAGKGQLTNDDMQKTLVALDQKIGEQKQQENNAIAAKELKAGQDFLAKNAKNPDVKTTQTGLQYKIIKQGTGKTPKASDTVVVTYKGQTVEGVVFDERKEPTTVKIDGLIPGWVEGLQLMKEGAEFELYIPPKLGFGENGGGQIPPNATLIFNVKLLEVK